MMETENKQQKQHKQHKKHKQHKQHIQSRQQKQKEQQKQHKPERFFYEFRPKDIRYVPLYKYEKDFTFIVNGKKYETSRIVADLLSPKISQMHFINETMKEIEINTVNEGNFKNIIETIENQDNAKHSENVENAEKTEENGNFRYIKEREFICEILKILGNDTYSDLHPKFQEEQIEISNVFERIEEKIEYCEIIKDEEEGEIKENEQEIQGSESSFSRKLIESEIDFISSNFYKIDKERIKRLKVDIIEDIIRNVKLKIEDEDSLLTFLIDIYDKDLSKSYLFEYVKYENVSEDLMKRFVKIIHFKDMNYRIWESMNIRIIRQIKRKGDYLKDELTNELKERYHYKKIFSLKPKIKEFRGIIYNLTKEAGGNIDEKGFVKVSSSSVCSLDDYFQPRNIVEFNVFKYFYSENNKNEWICIDFKDRMIEATHYSIRSQWHFSKNSYNLRNWVIEGSKDNENWDIIDRRENCSELNGWECWYI